MSGLSPCKVSVQVMSEQQMEVRREGGRELIVTKVTQLSSPLLSSERLSFPRSELREIQYCTNLPPHFTSCWL